MMTPLATDLGTRRLLIAAGEAPSVQNTQPWRFRVVRREYVELSADPERRLTVGDPRARSLHVSCGAALLNLRLAVRQTGHHPLVWLLPEPGLLAAVRFKETEAPLPAERRLYAAIPARRTNREPYGDRTVPAGIIGDMKIVASREGACLVVPDHTDPRHRRGHPQMIIRFGFGPPVPRAPRRPVTELEIHHVR